jgi:polyisoprenoid-binding protein YceI
MEATNGPNTCFSKQLNLLKICALLFALWAAPCAKAAQANPATPTLPGHGTYKIDPDHTFVYFSAWHHIVGLVRGRFDKVTGTITVSSDPAGCSVDVAIDTSTLDTQVAERDADLRSPAFFDVKNFPVATYRGRGIRRTSGNSWTLDGTLTIRGIAVVVPVTFTFKGIFPDTKPGRPARASFHAIAATNRSKFDMTRDNRMELGVPPAPGQDVQIEIDVEADATSPTH